jgi:DNA polymerase-3 subunit delta'
LPVDGCNDCANCRKVSGGNHADVRWLRRESKSRFIVTGPVRSLICRINLKPTEGVYKCAVIVAAVWLKVAAANAFLKLKLG